VWRNLQFRKVLQSWGRKTGGGPAWGRRADEQDSIRLIRLFRGLFSEISVWCWLLLVDRLWMGGCETRRRAWIRKSGGEAVWWPSGAERAVRVSLSHGGALVRV
jgi:hypothetical protein